MFFLCVKGYQKSSSLSSKSHGGKKESLAAPKVALGGKCSPRLACRKSGFVIFSSAALQLLQEQV
jgi:hypothetical protein